MPVAEFRSQIAAPVEQRLERLLDAEMERWQALDPELRAPLEALGDLVRAGGKRLRPQFCAWGFVAAGGDPADPRLIDAGAAFELLHAFALFHDDVMDGSALRRGVRTTHLAFGDRHSDGNWLGEARRFGEGVAILVGDLAFVYADRLLSGAPSAVWDVWNELRIELNIGQYLDLVGTARAERDDARASMITRFKSGKYTVERPLHLGAALAAPERSAEMQPVLSAYGVPLGDAFQLRDDVLGAFGDERLTGKPVGEDLREGKPTPLLALAWAAANPAQRAVLERVGSTELAADPAGVGAVQQVLVETGALAALEERIRRLTAQAIEAVRGAPFPLAVREGLVALADEVAFRDA